MIHELLKDKRLVLASASPRRKEIFGMLGLCPLIIPSNVHEPAVNGKPWTTVQKHARHKAQSIKPQFDPETLIVAADTLVYVDNRTLGKPANKKQAEAYLQILSGRKHIVYTGVCVIWRDSTITDYDKSKVLFNEMAPNEIRSYLKTCEPLDKAGAYGIQGFGSQFIKEVNGCYFNVMGFPVHLFYKMLQRLFSLI